MCEQRFDQLHSSTLELEPCHPVANNRKKYHFLGVVVVAFEYYINYDNIISLGDGRIYLHWLYFYAKDDHSRLSEKNWNFLSALTKATTVCNFPSLENIINACLGVQILSVTLLLNRYLTLYGTYFSSLH